MIGIFAIFGAFLLGAVLSDEERLAQAIRPVILALRRGTELEWQIEKSGFNTL